jgi:uncharacterized membrane protein YdjX (TVP38/TMEM64 family)
VELKDLPQNNWKNIVGLAAVLGVLYALARYFDIETVRAQIENAGIWAPLLFILVKSMTIIVAPLGGSPLYPIAGALFGFYKGSLLLILGDVLGGVVSFLLARIFGRRLVEKMLEGNENLLTRALLMMSTTKGYFFARLGFIGFPELASWGAGLTKIRFLPFILIYTLVGAPPTIAVAGLGALLVEESALGVPLISLFGVLVASGSLGIFVLMLGKDKKE